MLPFGIQSKQIHLNTWKDKEFDNFKFFVERNKGNFISFNQAKNQINNNVINDTDKSDKKGPVTSVMGNKIIKK